MENDIGRFLPFASSVLAQCAQTYAEIFLVFVSFWGFYIIFSFDLKRYLSGFE